MAVLDEEGLLAISVYIDLNPVAAQVAKTPETSEHTSIKQRLKHVEAQGTTAQLEAAKNGSVAGSRAAAGLEDSLWLCPIEDRRGLDSTREGMMQSFSLGSMSKWSTTPGDSFATANPRSRRNWPAFLSVLAAVPRPGIGACIVSTAAGCWAATCGHAGEIAGNQQAAPRAARGQPGGLSGAMTRSWILERADVVPAR